jgi:hypothetical protein
MVLSIVSSDQKNINFHVNLSDFASSVVDPDPKLLAGSGKKHSGFGQLRIRNEFEIKLLGQTDKI